MTAAVTILASVVPAHAAPSEAVREVRSEASQTRDVLLNMNAEVDSWRLLATTDAEVLARTALESRIPVGGGLDIDPDGARAWRIDDVTRIVRIPAVPGQNVLTQSSVSVLFDNAGAIVGSSQVILTPESVDSGRVQSWVNGALVVDQVVNAAGETSSPPSLARGYKKGDWWGNFNQCLSNAGVASWAIAALAVACSAICVVTAGFGCIGCLGAASAGVSGTVSFCITTANLRS
jgi:hypothetical protein